MPWFDLYVLNRLGVMKGSMLNHPPTLTPRIGICPYAHGLSSGGTYWFACTVSFHVELSPIIGNPPTVKLVNVTLKSVVSYHVNGSRIVFFAEVGISSSLTPFRLLLLGSLPLPEVDALPPPPEDFFFDITTATTTMTMTSNNITSAIHFFLRNHLLPSSSSISSALTYPPLLALPPLPSSSKGPLTLRRSLLPSLRRLCFTFPLPPPLSILPVTIFSFTVLFSLYCLSFFSRAFTAL